MLLAKPMTTMHAKIVLCLLAWRLAGPAGLVTVSHSRIAEALGLIADWEADRFHKSRAQRMQTPGCALLILSVSVRSLPLLRRPLQKM